ncbi:MAG TPA: hypothetical protein VLB46_08660 [Pyrinomonadaceae bacterium]|nr:hypothetical protein [Pyrinomonadaceae bacterium]
MRIITKITFVVIIFWIAVPPARGSCFCVAPEVTQAFEKARAVFVGELLEVVPPRSTDKDAVFADRVHTARFKVEITWKGPFWTEANVLAPQGNCFSFQPLRAGEKYLVYADPVADSSKSTDVLITACNRTKMLSTSITEPGLFEHLFGSNTADDIRILNNVIMTSSPRARPDPVPWLKFLEP